MSAVECAVRRIPFRTPGAPHGWATKLTSWLTGEQFWRSWHLATAAWLLALWLQRRLTGDALRLRTAAALESVAAGWLLATLGLALLFAGCAWWIFSAETPWWQHAWLEFALTLLSLSVASGFVCAYRTTETLELRSLTGRAILLRYEGSLGTFRRARPFLEKLTAHIRHASKARRSTRAEHLRDEMREHFRLKEAGAISDADYEAAKARILGQHA